MITATSCAFSLAVYCGSRTGLSPAHANQARLLGQWIGHNKGQLVYGGGGYGLMGILANETLAHGGRVVGIIPQSMVEREWSHQDVSELMIVQTMHERKAAMIGRSDAILAISGGIGTLDEFFEAWTWRQLGYHDKPVGLLNIDGYFDHLLSFLQQSIEEDFLGQHHRDLLHTADSIDGITRQLLPQLFSAS
jgi:uncharacterized protein (TIGR00730 family)